MLNECVQPNEERNGPPSKLSKWSSSGMPYRSCWLSGIPVNKSPSSYASVFPLLQSPMVTSFTTLQPTLGIAHGDLRLVCGCSAMETHFMKLPTKSSVLLLLPEAVWNSVVSVAIEDTQFLSATFFITRWSHSLGIHCSKQVIWPLTYL